MSLFETLKARSLTARKANDVVAKAIYGVLMGEIARAVDPGKEIDDGTVSKIAEKTIAGIQTTLDKGGDNATLVQEIALLTEFVIAKVSDEEVKAFVEKFIADNGPFDPKKMGIVMTALKAKFGSENLDNGAASRIVKVALL